MAEFNDRTRCRRRWGDVSYQRIEDSDDTSASESSSDTNSIHDSDENFVEDDFKAYHSIEEYENCDSESDGSSEFWDDNNDDNNNGDNNEDNSNEQDIFTARNRSSWNDAVPQHETLMANLDAAFQSLWVDEITDGNTSDSEFDEILPSMSDPDY